MVQIGGDNLKASLAVRRRPPAHLVEQFGYRRARARIPAAVRNGHERWQRPGPGYLAVRARACGVDHV